MKFRKKPVVIDAMPYGILGLPELKEFLGYDKLVIDKNNRLIIHTLEGDMYAEIGDWIIRGVKGEYYPCKPGIFKQTYEQVIEN